MKVVVAAEPELSQQIAQAFIQQIQVKPNSVLGLATGSTPIHTYQHLVEAYKAKQVSFKDVVTFNLDEYVGLEGTHHQSYRYFMNTQLFDHIDIQKEENTHVLLGTGDAESLQHQAKAFDAKIQECGGIDLQILGLGSDGHIGFNEPGTPFDSLTHCTSLAPSTITDNARLFDDISEVPTQAVTMGLHTIMQARRILLMATGPKKAEAVYHLVKGPVTEEWPCSILQRHPDCAIFVDAEAYALVSSQKE